MSGPCMVTQQTLLLLWHVYIHVFIAYTVQQCAWVWLNEKSVPALSTSHTVKADLLKDVVGWLPG